MARMALVSDLLSWLQGLPEPGLVAATGGLVFAECTIGLGFLAPGESGLLIAATTANTVARFLALWTVVTLCATAGDALGYAIGRRFGPRLRETKLIRKCGLEAWDKATSVLERRGAWAVFFARFLPVIRTLTPAAAGTSGLPFRRFLPHGRGGRVLLVAGPHQHRRRPGRSGEAHRRRVEHGRLDRDRCAGGGRGVLLAALEEAQDARGRRTGVRARSLKRKALKGTLTAFNALKVPLTA